MKKYFLLFAAFFLLASAAWAEEPDLQGWVTRIDYSKNELVVRNMLKNNIGSRDYRVVVKQGMINDYKMSDKLKIWLDPDNPKLAAMIERLRD